MPGALSHYLERVAEVYLPRFDLFFPSAFDWQRLVADVPEMARRRRVGAGDDEVDEETLGRSAASVFQASHLMALALLAAGGSGPEDPEVVLDRLAGRPEDEEDEAFSDLVSRCLDAVEERLAERDDVPEPTDDEDVERAALLASLVWPAVAEILSVDEGGIFRRSGPDADLLWSLARVAAVLAAFRWMVAERAHDDWPRLADQA